MERSIDGVQAVEKLSRARRQELRWKLALMPLFVLAGALFLRVSGLGAALGFAAMLCYGAALQRRIRLAVEFAEGVDKNDAGMLAPLAEAAWYDDPGDTSEDQKATFDRGQAAITDAIAAILSSGHPVDLSILADHEARCLYRLLGSRSPARADDAKTAILTALIASPDGRAKHHLEMLLQGSEKSHKDLAETALAKLQALADRQHERGTLLRAAEPVQAGQALLRPANQTTARNEELLQAVQPDSQ